MDVSSTEAPAEVGAAPGKGDVIAEAGALPLGDIVTTNLAFRPESLRRLRVRAGFAQRQLADAAGIPHGFVNNWERSSHLRPDDEQLTALADALGVTPDQLGTPQRRLTVQLGLRRDGTWG